MLRFIYGNELDRHSRLADGMFRDRAEQFRNRLGWTVTVDRNGHEKDKYDRLNPLYVIWEDERGRHGGSMRFLPTTGPVMVNDVFGHLTGGAPITSPLIWECTRFCLAPQARSSVAATLMLGGGALMRGFGVAQFAGVFDRRMVRIYRMLGSEPDILGQEGSGADEISVGLWAYCQAAHERIARRSGISTRLAQHWFERAFGANRRSPKTMIA